MAEELNGATEGGESDTNVLLYAGYSNDRAAWCVLKPIDSTSSSYLWKCRNEQDAKTLAHEVNNGAAICKGCKEFRNNCGTCVKCTLSI